MNAVLICFLWFKSYGTLMRCGDGSRRFGSSYCLHIRG